MTKKTKKAKTRSYRGAKLKWDRVWFETMVGQVRINGQDTGDAYAARALVILEAGRVRTPILADAYGATIREACDAALAALVERLRGEAAERTALADAIEAP
jgi:hypothetical protein